MPCSGKTSANKDCGIPTQKKYCHIHVAKYEKMERDAKLSYRVKEQTKILGRMNVQMDTIKTELSKEKSEKIEALLENERLKKELLMLKDEKEALQEKAYNLKREVKDGRLTMKTNQRLKKRVVELEDEHAQLVAMKDDYEAYQTIKHFEYIHHQLMKLYGETTAIGITLAMKRSPKMAESILGYKPWKKYNKMRDERNALAHVI